MTLEIPGRVEINLTDRQINVKGSKGSLELQIHRDVEVVKEGNLLKFSARGSHKQGNAMSGTIRSLVNNMVIGVSQGFEKKLLLNGVGYRAKAAGKSINLTLGFSHPVDYQVPEGVSAETPSQTEIVITGADKQLIGQVAADIRAYRPPEPYKGKGIRYSDEHVRRKEAKKK